MPRTPDSSPSLAPPPVVGNSTTLALQHPLTALTILAPLCLLGEVMRLIAGTSVSDQHLLGDPLLIELGRLVGLHLPFAALVALVVWWLVVQIGARHPWRVPPLRAVGMVFVWGGVWAICRLAVALFFGRALGDSMAGTSGLLISGAIQEELIFRGVLLGLGLAIIRAYDAPQWMVYAIVLPLSAIFFSLAHTAVVNHHIGAEPFAWLPFCERCVAGGIYGYAFIRQGLGVSTLAHLGYLAALESSIAPYLR